MPIAMLMLSLERVLLGQLVASTAVTALTTNGSYGPLHFKATFGSSPMPMTIDVDPSFIAETRLKASLTRNPIDIDLPLFTEGVPSHNLTAIRDYWVNQYNWSAVQNDLNTNFNHFTTTVEPLPSPYNYTKQIPLHFVHHRSSHSNAIPLLFIHGWPGSFLEVAKILEPLTEPPPSEPAFHVVAPSIPGFGFSPAPTSPGFGLIEAAAAFNDLMGQLGYDRFVVQGGDFGSHTARYMGAMFPESVVSILSNLYNVNPNATDLERQAQGETTAEENAYIDFTEGSEPFYNAFWGIEKTVPLQVAILLGDSPVGNIAWSYLGIRSFSPGYSWGIEELITWGMMLYIPGPYGNTRIYVELEREKTLEYDFPYISNPVGILQYYPDAAYGAPQSWCERTGNVTYFVKKPEDVLGGHFPAHINPTDLVDEMRKFWGFGGRWLGHDELRPSPLGISPL